MSTVAIDTKKTKSMEVTMESGETYWWCACEKSENQPFCDRSHKGTTFTPLRYQATDTARKYFRGCKSTASAPICDGGACSKIP